MTLWKAIVMGIVQGLTEFLPVSSSAHLAILKNILNIDLGSGILFDIILHLGTLTAICIAYWQDISKMVQEGIGILVDCVKNIQIFLNKEEGKAPRYIKIVNSTYRKFVMLVLVSIIPTGVIGFATKELVEAADQLLIIPGICLLITSALLSLSERVPEGNKLPKKISYTNGFLIGIVQGIATLPGISRSGSTITACMVSGFDKRFAVKFSFIMSIPAILGAAILEIKDAFGEQVAAKEWIYYLVGAVVAGVVGYACIRTMLVLIKNKGFYIFSAYCFIVGSVTVGAFFIL